MTTGPRLWPASEDGFDMHQEAFSDLIQCSRMAGARPGVVGALAETIGYNPLFVMLALFDLAGAAVLWALLRGERADQPSKAG
jgi:hypothetical protein